MWFNPPMKMVSNSFRTDISSFQFMLVSSKLPRYQQWPGRNTFLCGGRLMTGSHGGHLLLTGSLILGSWLVFIVSIIPFLHQKILYPISIVYVTVNLGLLFSTAFTEPGILPRRQLNQAPLSNEVKEKSENYCPICDIVRSKRAKHCRYCDNCIEVLDHHCPWTGTCIGVRNYKLFLSFLLSLITGLLFMLLCAVIVLIGCILNTPTNAYYFRLAAVCVTIPWCLFMSGPIAVLLSFHAYLCWTGVTTSEYFRNKKAAAVHNSDNTGVELTATTNKSVDLQPPVPPPSVLVASGVASSSASSSEANYQQRTESHQQLSRLQEPEDGFSVVVVGEGRQQGSRCTDCCAPDRQQYSRLSSGSLNLYCSVSVALCATGFGLLGTTATSDSNGNNKETNRAESQSRHTKSCCVYLLQSAPSTQLSVMWEREVSQY